MVRIMNFYAGDPYRFELTDLTDIGTLHRLSTVLQESDACAETRKIHASLTVFHKKTIQNLTTDILLHI